MSTTMRAAVCARAGGPEVLEIRELPVPAVREGWSLVQVKAAGLNRSELRTRQGHSPNVTFPRVLGIECVGIVADSTDPMLPDGTTVAAVMGEMGREFDGGYAEYASLPNSVLMPVTRRDRGHDSAARQDRRADCGRRRPRARRRRRVAGSECARRMARGSGPCSGSRRG